MNEPERPGWKKAPEHLVALFASVVPGPPAEARKMFGYPAAFVNGNMFMGVHQESFFVRLGEEQRERLVKLGATAFEPMPGRPMREYVVLPESVLASKAKLKTWVTASLAHAQSLPAKASKRKGAAKKPTAKKLKK